MTPIYLSEADVQAVLTMPVALQEIERAMCDRALGRASDSPRARAAGEAGALRVLQAIAPELGCIGFKYTYARPGRRCSFVHLIDLHTAELQAIVDADWLGAMRTGAASGVAARHLANPGAATLGQLGSGRQAYAQLEAVVLALSITRVQVYSPTRSRLEAFCEFMSRKLGIAVQPADSGEAAVQGADVINVITKSSQPVLEGAWLSPGQHINAAGANALSRRELDEEAISRCDVITVDGRANAREECGDLLPAVTAGRLAWDGLPEIGEVMLGRVQGRASAQQISLYESHGLGIQDIYLAARVLELARDRQVGAPVPVTALADAQRKMRI